MLLGGGLDNLWFCVCALPRLREAGQSLLNGTERKRNYVSAPAYLTGGNSQQVPDQGYI